MKRKLFHYERKLPNSQSQKNDKVFLYIVGLKAKRKAFLINLFYLMKFNFGNSTKGKKEEKRKIYVETFKMFYGFRLIFMIF